MKSKQKPKIVILTGSAGSGHVSAAKSMAAEYHLMGYEAVVLDTAKYMSDFSKWAFTKGWIYLATILKPLYSFFHYLLNHKLTFYRSIVRAGQKKLYKKFAKELEEMNPDILISTHAVGVVLSSIYKKNHPSVFVAAQTTDFQAINTYSFPEVDMICATDENSKKDFVKYGVKANRVALLGPAVKKEFFELPAKKRSRGKLNLPKDKTIILVSRGGIGTSAKFTAKLMEDILKLPYDLHVLANTANSEYLIEASKKLGKKYPGRITDTGYVTNFYDYLNASDIFVCKPGGLNISETLNTKVPPIAFRAMPGQEEWNISFIQEKNLGFYGKNRKEIIKYLKLLMDDSKVREKIQKNLNAYDHIFSPKKISEEILRRYKKSIA